MKLYYSKGACSLATRIIINEIGEPCEYESVDLASKKTADGQNFYTINPKGSVPALTTDKGALLTENSVIMQYLADTYKNTPLLPLIGHLDRYKVLEWLSYISSDLHKGFGPLFNREMPQEIKDKFFIPAIKSKFNFINEQLDKTKYLSGDHFTLPDAYLFVILRWAQHFKFDMAEWPALSAYFVELKNRASIQKSLQEEGLV